MKHMSKTTVALLVLALAAVLLSSGCREKTAQIAPGEQYASTAQSTPTACPTVACPTGTAPTSGSAVDAAIISEPATNGKKIFVELAKPQSDDQGNYTPVQSDTNYPVLGYASGPNPVTQVMVNGVEADTYPTDYRPYGYQEGYQTVGFRSPTYLGPRSQMTITVIDGNGYRETRLFHPDRVRTYTRVHQLWQGSQRDPYANVRLANVYVVQRDYRDAYPLYHRSVGLSAGFVWGPFFLGLALYDNNRYDDAIYQYRRSRQIRPDFYMANYEIGRTYERRGDYSRAIVEYRVVTTSYPTFVAAHWSLGESYVQVNNWDGASVEYRQAIQYNPGFAPAHRGLGEVYARQGQWSNASTSLMVAMNLSPRDPRAYADLRSVKVRRQRSPKEYRVAMAPLKAPRGYDKKVEQSTMAWQGRAVGGRQKGQAVKLQGAQKRPQVVQPTSWTQPGKPADTRNVKRPASTTVWQQQGKPTGGQKATAHKNTASGGQQFKQSGGQKNKASGAQKNKVSGGQQFKQSGGQKAAVRKSNTSGGQQFKQSGGQKNKVSGAQKNKVSGSQQSKQSGGKRSQQNKQH